MPDTGKLKPEVSARGVFFPWATVFAIGSALTLMVCIPLVGVWLELREFKTQASANSAAIIEIKKENKDDAALDAVTRERVSALEARK